MSENSSDIGSKFLSKKYKLQGSSEVKGAIQRTKIRTAESVSPTLDAHIENYLSRFEEIVDREDLEQRRKGLSALKKLLHKKYVIQHIPESHLALQRRIMLEAGHGAEIPDQFTSEQLGDYLDIIQNDQKESLDAWIDELASTGDEYPSWAKYWAIRSMLQMGPYDKEQHRFSKRTLSTTAPFPDLNQEALSTAVDYIIAVQEGSPLKNPVKEGDNEFAEERKLVSDDTFLKILNAEDFAKYYAFAVEHVTADNSELFRITEGEWRIFPQGSDAYALTSTIQGHGTGWCTAGSNTAQSQLEEGDFYVYFSKNDLGEAKIPRLAIWMNGDSIAEVRGVAHKQEIDPYIGPVLEEKLAEFGAQGEQYTKKVHDMKLMTELVQKQKMNEQFSKEDLEFLFEKKSEIEGFGYGKDPRIEEIISERKDSILDDLKILADSTDWVDVIKESYNYNYSEDIIRTLDINQLSKIQAERLADFLLEKDIYTFLQYKDLLLPQVTDAEIALNIIDKVGSEFLLHRLHFFDELTPGVAHELFKSIRKPEYTVDFSGIFKNADKFLSSKEELVFDCLITADLFFFRDEIHKNWPKSGEINYDEVASRLINEGYGEKVELILDLLRKPLPERIASSLILENESLCVHHPLVLAKGFTTDTFKKIIVKGNGGVVLQNYLKYFKGAADHNEVVKWFLDSDKVSDLSRNFSNLKHLSVHTAELLKSSIPNFHYFILVNQKSFDNLPDSFMDEARVMQNR